jgi:DNA polymerase III alpha subunit
MKTDQYGQIILNEQDVFRYIMQGYDLSNLKNVLYDKTINLESLANIIDDASQFLTWTFYQDSDKSVPIFDKEMQDHYHMPDEYRNIDIAAYVLGLCKTEAELQRVGDELLRYQELDLFPLLKYLKYFVDVLNANHVIWGVGRGSSVASYVLYLLGVHKVDSLYYDLPITEFLR